MSKKNKKRSLTNETLLNHFDDNFSLALSAIHLAREQIRSGKYMQLSEILDQTAKIEDAKAAEKKLLEQEKQEVS